MPKIAVAAGSLLGLAAVIVVFLVFLAHEFVKAGESNVAVGIGVLLYVATRPTFLVTAAMAFGLAFYKVAG